MGLELPRADYVTLDRGRESLYGHLNADRALDICRVLVQPFYRVYVDGFPTS